MTIVQVPGKAMRMKTDVFKSSVKLDSPLHSLLLRYTNTLMLQLSQSTACISHHSVEERCCRWLLMTCDRVHTVIAFTNSLVPKAFLKLQCKLANVLASPRQLDSEYPP
ncbi:MAG: hypothetical protein F6K28_18750 [Microcoleus sp. SIO2G3]|nr:hypothetical protein [Microcoleus sp. SIO2G3]